MKVIQHETHSGSQKTGRTKTYTFVTGFIMYLVT